jgi:transposase
LRTDLLPEAHVRPKEDRSIQQALRQRLFFVRVQTMVKNRIHVLIDRQVTVRETAQGFTDLFGKAGMEFLRTVELPAQERELLDGDLALLEAVRERIAESNEVIKELSRGDEGVSLVKTIPGFGAFLSVLVTKEIGGIGRFATAEKLCSYAGLVPSVYASGGKSYTGRITKQGNKWLRWALVEAVVPAIRADAGLRGYYERIKRRKGANSAKVATARRLLTIVYRCLKDNRVYEKRLPGVEYGTKTVRTAFATY